MINKGVILYTKIGKQINKNLGGLNENH